MTGVAYRISEARVRSGGDWRYWGVWASRDEALEWAATLPWSVGYDTGGIAEQHVPIFERMHLFDYPAMHWIESFLAGEDEGCVFDVGGHLGMKRVRYGERAVFPDRLRWIVGETETLFTESSGPLRDRVPEGVEVTSGFDRLGEADVVFASGVLQYLDVDLSTLLAGVRPVGVVINKVPLSTGKAHWTVERSAHAVVPYRVFNREDFLGRMRALGYGLVDEWQLDYGVEIPYHSEWGTTWNSGAAFRRLEAP